MSRIVGIDLGTTNSLVAHVDASGIPRDIDFQYVAAPERFSLECSSAGSS